MVGNHRNSELADVAHGGKYRKRNNNVFHSFLVKKKGKKRKLLMKNTDLIFQWTTIFAVFEKDFNKRNVS